MLKKGDDGAVDDDDDVVRTKVSQTMWQQHCVLRNSSSRLSIYQPGKNVCGGKEKDG
jgi:hypothetical protein